MVDANAGTNAPRSPQGWYPAESGRQRWWDGSQWTNRYLDQEPAPPPTPTESVWTDVERDGNVVNKQLGRFDKLWTGLIVLVPSIASSALGPAVQGHTQSWLTIFFATFAWSGGVLLATYFIVSGAVSTVPGGVATALACLVAASAIATVLGQPSFDLSEIFGTDVSSGPIWVVASEYIAVFFFQAFRVYGWLGSILGLGVGIWLGYRTGMSRRNAS